MIDQMRQIDGRIPVSAKIEPLLLDLRSLVKSRWGDMLPQTRKGCESAIASLEAALMAERDHARRHFVVEAAKGQLGPARNFRAVE